jgi:uncharacterized protein (TIGR03084 family)
MFQQAQDLREEGAELKSILDDLKAEDWAKQTPFKTWTVNQVVQHLHGSDKMAVLALKDAEGFTQAKSDPKTVGALMNPLEEGVTLLETWWAYFSEMCDLLSDSDPKRRVPWFGPDMGVMMFTTARQMETWSHGQDIFDMFGRTRINTNRLKNIAVIGVRTYGWTFANRKSETPGPEPYVRLTSPEGDLWEFNEPSTENFVEGDAVAFCHVVTQGRNIADVELQVEGTPAIEWMRIAQCFAGPPEDPPAAGSRTVNF